jgi:hypothetical protein
MILPGHKGNFWEITAVITAVMNISAVHYGQLITELNSEMVLITELNSILELAIPF